MIRGHCPFDDCRVPFRDLHSFGFLLGPEIRSTLVHAPIRVDLEACAHKHVFFSVNEEMILSTLLCRLIRPICLPGIRVLDNLQGLLVDAIAITVHCQCNELPDPELVSSPLLLLGLGLGKMSIVLSLGIINIMFGLALIEWVLGLGRENIVLSLRLVVASMVLCPRTRRMVFKRQDIGASVVTSGLLPFRALP